MAGYFCRRLEPTDVEILMSTVNNARVNVWQQHRASFFEEAVIEGDSMMAETTASASKTRTSTTKGSGVTTRC